MNSVGALVVTTPQQAALQVTRRGVTMLQKLEVPVIGLVQNMSSFVCSSCMKRNELFGPGINEFASKLGKVTLELYCIVLSTQYIVCKSTRVVLHIWCPRAREKLPPLPKPYLEVKKLLT